MHALSRGRAVLQSRRCVQNCREPAAPIQSVDAGQRGRDVRMWWVMCNDGTILAHPGVCDDLPPSVSLRASASRGREQSVHLPPSQLSPPCVLAGKGDVPVAARTPNSLTPPSSPHSAQSTTILAPQYSECVRGQTDGCDTGGDRHHCRETPLHSHRPKYASRGHLQVAVGCRSQRQRRHSQRMGDIPGLRAPMTPHVHVLQPSVRPSPPPSTRCLLDPCIRRTSPLRGLRTW